MSVPSVADAATAGVVVLGAQALAAWGWRRLRALPEPADGAEPTGWVKPPYRVVADVRMLVAVLTLAGALATVGVLSRPVGLPEAAWLPVMLGWGTAAGLGTVAVVCDLRTTYLPAGLMRPWERLTALAVMGSWGVAVVSDGARAAAPVLRVTLCVVMARILFWCLWRFGGRFGYGDVRLATILAADAALVSASTWGAWLVAGTVTGALWAFGTVVARRRRPSLLGTAFAYGPSLAVGAWVALVVR